MKFDIITLLAVLGHIQKPYELFINIKKLLKQNGVLFLLFPTFSILSTAPAHINFLMKVLSNIY